MCIFSATFVYADFRRSGDSASVYFRSRIRVNEIYTNKLYHIKRDFSCIGHQNGIE